MRHVRPGVFGRPLYFFQKIIFYSADDEFYENIKGTHRTARANRSRFSRTHLYREIPDIRRYSNMFYIIINSKKVFKYL